MSRSHLSQSTGHTQNQLTCLEKLELLVSTLYLQMKKRLRSCSRQKGGGSPGKLNTDDVSDSSTSAEQLQQLLQTCWNQAFSLKRNRPKHKQCPWMSSCPAGIKRTTAGTALLSKTSSLNDRLFSQNQLSCVPILLVPGNETTTSAGNDWDASPDFSVTYVYTLA